MSDQSLTVLTPPSTLSERDSLVRWAKIGAGVAYIKKRELKMMHLDGLLDFIFFVGTLLLIIIFTYWIIYKISSTILVSWANQPWLFRKPKEKKRNLKKGPM